MTAAPLNKPSFSIIPGTQVQEVLSGREKDLIDVVEATYRLHGSGGTINPPSYFLHFPERPLSRIIALPASLGGNNSVDGIKWISSFPENVVAGIPRASAVLVLNDHETGYPFVCMESSVISATRTAASAALAADWLTRARRRPATVGFIGTGLIARYIHTYLAGTGFAFDEIGIHDVSADHASGFHRYLDGADIRSRVKIHGTAEELIRSSELVVFATIAGEPHVTEPGWFSHNPVILHVSLRDVSADIVLGCTNIVDDVDHCLKANTSPHLALIIRGGDGCAYRSSGVDLRIAC